MISLLSFSDFLQSAAKPQRICILRFCMLCRCKNFIRLFVYWQYLYNQLSGSGSAPGAASLLPAVMFYHAAVFFYHYHDCDHIDDHRADQRPLRKMV